MLKVAVKRKVVAAEAEGEVPVADQGKTDQGEAAAEGEAENLAEKEEVKPMEVEAEKPKEPEKPKELEEDAAADSRKKLPENSVAWNMADCTLNVLPAFDGKVLSSLQDNGFSNLLASVRGNTGIKAGRYMFEVKVLEQGHSNTNGKPVKNTVRVGLGLAGSCLLSEEDSIYFDNDGSFVHGKKRVKTNQKFIKGATVAIVVNMDATSPNADTVSVFNNGTRICQPQKLPEEWKGKTLFPIATYRNVTLQANFGPQLASKMPFACRMLSDAAKEDVVVIKPAGDGKPEVLLPVGLPEEGVFDWADDFLAKNPSYTELSARKMLDWGVKSGLSRKGGKTSLDRPEMGFSIPNLDDFSVLKLAKSIAPFHKGNYLVMEMKSNLASSERKTTLEKFPGFRKRAAVLMGTPSTEYKAMVQAHLLKSKKIKAEAEQKRKDAEVARKRVVEEGRRKVEAAKKAKLAAKEDGEEPEEMVEEKAEDEAPAPEETQGPVTLTDEEKAIVFLKHEAPDMTLAATTKHFANFSLPAQSEGFDVVDFLWQNEAGSITHMQDYILQRKLTTRVETLQPGDWFKKEWKEWQALLTNWRKRQTEWKNPATKKALLAKMAAEKKAAQPEKGEEGATEEAAEEAEPMKIDADDLDPFSVEDVMDIGDGEPLFVKFAFEDWMLLSLRYELHLLAHAFKKDMNDPERAGFHESHLGFYYNKYFHKQCSSKTYGCDSWAEVAELIEQNISVSKAGILGAVLSEDAPPKGFVHVVEDQRRDRERRVEAGVESAQLKFQKQPQAPAHAPHATISPTGQGQKRPFTPEPNQGKGQQKSKQQKTSAGSKSAGKTAGFKATGKIQPGPKVVRPPGAPGVIAPTWSAKGNTGSWGAGTKSAGKTAGFKATGKIQPAGFKGSGKTQKW